MFPRVLIQVLAVVCLSGLISSGVALLLGIAVALFLSNPYSEKMRANTHRLLSASVMGLGAGMNLVTVAQVGARGFGYTILGISFAMATGYALGRLLKIHREPSLLVSTGTAICGGSAIAAMSSAVRAQPHNVSVSLAIVFTLNAIALLIFPAIGHQLGLDETQFGLWAALAIHDTSSVVGASMQYGPHALEVGTTVKLARALWIVPLTLGISHFYNRGSQEASTMKTKRPWFILGFIGVAAIVTWIPETAPAGRLVETVARRLLVLTLFFIGCSLKRDAIRSVGFKPFVQGVLLWICVASASLAAILAGWISI